MIGAAVISATESCGYPHPSVNFQKTTYNLEPPESPRRLQSMTSPSAHRILQRLTRDATSVPMLRRCEHEFAAVRLGKEGRHVAIDPHSNARSIGHGQELQCRKCGQWLSLSA